MHEARKRLADPRVAVAYLRRTVVNRARSVYRRRPGADGSTRSHDFEREPVVVMLGWLPDRQREALVLCYYGGLSEAEAAAAMGISKAALRRHAIGGMAALRRSWLND